MEWKKSAANSPLEALIILNEGNTQLINVKDDNIRNWTNESLDMDVGESNRLNPIEEQISSLREVCDSLNNNLSYRDTPFVALNPEKTKKESEEALIEVNNLPPKIRNYEAAEIMKKDQN